MRGALSRLDRLLSVPLPSKRKNESNDARAVGEIGVGLVMTGEKTAELEPVVICDSLERVWMRSASRASAFDCVAGQSRWREERLRWIVLEAEPVEGVENAQTSSNVDDRSRGESVALMSVFLWVVVQSVSIMASVSCLLPWSLTASGTRPPQAVLRSTDPFLTSGPALVCSPRARACQCPALSPVAALLTSLMPSAAALSCCPYPNQARLARAKGKCAHHRPISVLS